MKHFLIILFAILAGFGSLEAKARQVALELVLAVDTSTSVDDREFQLIADRELP